MQLGRRPQSGKVIITVRVVSGDGSRFNVNPRVLAPGDIFAAGVRQTERKSDAKRVGSFVLVVVGFCRGDENR